MYCKTKSIFRSCTTEVLEGYDIRSPIYDFSDFEDDSLPRGNAKPKKSRKHKSKSKHKRKRRKERRKEKRQQENDQVQGQQEELAQDEAQNAVQRSTKTKRPAVPVEVSCDSSKK